MLHGRVRLLAGPLSLWLVACADPGPSPTAIDPPPPSDGELAFFAPSPESLDFRLVDAAEVGERPAPGHPGPLAVDDWVDFDDPVEEYEPARIYGARTDVGIQGTMAYADGMHRFDGHGTRLETSLDVLFKGKPVGHEVAVLQRSWWLSIGTKFVTTHVEVQSDVTCGLSAKGHSTHEAWLELFSGKSAPIWGKMILTSDGKASQDQCGEYYTDSDPGGAQMPGGLVCYYLVTYDLETGEVVHAERLFCKASGGTLV